VDRLTRWAYEAGTGDSQALDALVRATYKDVWRLCAALVDPQSADDLAQESFLRAMKALPSFRGDAQARTWLLAIARNTSLDELRSRSRRRARDSSLVQEAPFGLFPADPGGNVVVADLLGRLSAERREVLVLTQLLGLSYDEAAAVCKCPVGTVRSRVARARTDLIALLDHSGPVQRTSNQARSSL
jgi:RNA polymerase sigma-70 factor (ECF subfamily)